MHLMADHPGWMIALASLSVKASALRGPRSEMSAIQVIGAKPDFLLTTEAV